MATADTSMYANAAPTPVPLNNPLDVANKAMALSTLGLQQQQMQMNQMMMQRQQQTQRSVQDAYSNNTDPLSGQLDRGGFLSDMGKNPMTAASVPGLQQEFAATDKAQAEAKSAQVDSVQKVVSIGAPTIQTLAKMPENQRAAAYPAYIQNLKAQGVNMSQFPDQYDPQHFQQAAQMMEAGLPAAKDYLANNATQATTAETQAKTQLTQAELPTAMATKAAMLQGEQFGSRSPYSTQQDAYNKEVAPIRGSQMAMNQMFDNYKNPTPQGDTSLVLNAYKIKFPTAPDVNSLEELSKSQSVPDNWKQLANKAISGGLDSNTRDNLMRDGISTFRANAGTLADTQQKYQDIAKQDNLPNANFTNEPGITNTLKQATTLQNKLGPYVPPSQRGGIMGGLSSMAASITGSGGPNKATAAAPSIKPGTVEDGYIFNGGDASNPKNWKKVR